jgi:hypothetical protein
MTPKLLDLLTSDTKIEPSSGSISYSFKKYLQKHNASLLLLKTGVFSVTLAIAAVAITPVKSFALSEINFNTNIANQSVDTHHTAGSRKTGNIQQKHVKMPIFSTMQSIESYFLDPEKGNNLFGAVATRMENIETSVYLDPARGRNIGIGYNMDAIGAAQSKEDFKAIGMKDEHIRILFSKQNQSQNIQQNEDYKKIYITPNQAVALLLLIQPRYEAIAKSWIGDEHWDKLSKNKQAAISYLAYQTGGNISQFKKAKAAIQSGNEQIAQKNLTPSYVSRDGVTTINTRFEAHVGTMWAGAAKYAEKQGYKNIAYKINENTEIKTKSSPDLLDSLIEKIQRISKSDETNNSPEARLSKIEIPEKNGPNVKTNGPPQSIRSF